MPPPNIFKIIKNWQEKVSPHPNIESLMVPPPPPPQSHSCSAVPEFAHFLHGASLHPRRCLHDTRSSFIPVRLHPGSILSIYICLHDTNQNCIPERVIPERLHPGSRIGSKFSFQNEICLHVPPVSCKGGTGSFRYGNKQVDWLG